MKRSISSAALVAIALGLIGCARETEPVASPTTTGAVTTTATSRKTPILINITRGKSDLHAVSMGLSLARTALESGHTVTVFLNVDAPVFAARDLPADARFADFPPISQMLRDVVDRGGRVLVCAHCASILRLDPASLQPGVTVARADQWLDGIAPGTLSLSY